MAGTTTHSGRVSIDVRGLQSLADGAASGNVDPKIIESLNLDNGVTDADIDLVYHDRTDAIAASATTVYDLDNLTDAFGNAVVFAEVCLIAIRNNRETVLATLEIGPDATAGFGVLASARGFWNAALGSGGGNIVHPKAIDDDASWLVLYNRDGALVGAASTDELSVITSAVVGSTNSWDLIVMGRSA